MDISIKSNDSWMMPLDYCFAGLWGKISPRNPTQALHNWNHLLKEGKLRVVCFMRRMLSKCFGKAFKGRGSDGLDARLGECDLRLSGDAEAALTDDALTDVALTDGARTDAALIDAALDGAALAERSVTDCLAMRRCWRMDGCDCILALSLFSASTTSKDTQPFQPFGLLSTGCDTSFTGLPSLPVSIFCILRFRELVASFCFCFSASSCRFFSSSSCFFLSRASLRCSSASISFSLSRLGFGPRKPRQV